MTDEQHIAHLRFWLGEEAAAVFADERTRERLDEEKAGRLLVVDTDDGE